MSSQKRGKMYEHALASDIFELTEGKIIPIRAGDSGNQALPMPDLMIPYGGALIAAEIKTTATDRSIIIEPEDVDQIRYWTMRMSEVPVYPYLFIKFRGRSHRLIYATRLTRVSNPERAFQLEVERCPFDAKVTRTGNLSFRKPDTDEWPFTQSGDGPKGLQDAHQVIQTFKEDGFEQPSVLDIIEKKNDYLEKHHSNS